MLTGGRPEDALDIVHLWHRLQIDTRAAAEMFRRMMEL
jgi:hypothetical protein